MLFCDISDASRGYSPFPETEKIKDARGKIRQKNVKFLQVPRASPTSQNPYIIIFHIFLNSLCNLWEIEHFHNFSGKCWKFELIQIIFHLFFRNFSKIFGRHTLPPPITYAATPWPSLLKVLLDSPRNFLRVRMEVE